MSRLNVLTSPQDDYCEECGNDIEQCSCWPENEFAVEFAEDEDLDAGDDEE